MNESARKFVREVVFTTCLSFLLISFFYVGVFALIGNKSGGGDQTFFQFFSYLFGKLYGCILPFSLCLGFLNRIFDRKKNRAMLRVIHFFLGFAAYVLFMDLAWNFMFEDGIVETRQLFLHTTPYFVFYPLCVWTAALGRAIFLPKEKKDFTSILD